MGLSAAKLASGYQNYNGTYNCNALSFSDVALPSLPTGLFEAPYSSMLTLLCISKNLTWIPPDIKRLTNLTTLDLGHNQISAYPDELFTVTTLKKLRLPSNQLPALPIAVAMLTQLEELHLSSNPLHSLPWSLFTLTSLKLMDLRSTMLNVIPEQVSLLTNLTSLNVAANPINELPEGLSRLTALQTLIASSCRMLRTVSPSLARLRALRHFGLSGTGLRAIPLWLVDLPRLEALSIEGTPAAAAHRPDLATLRRKVHNDRTFALMRVLGMLALEKQCFLRRLRGTLRPNASAVSAIEPSHFARLPSDLLFDVLRHVAPGYCDVVLKPAALREAYRFLAEHAETLEACAAARVSPYEVLFPRLHRPPHAMLENCRAFAFDHSAVAFDILALHARMSQLRRMLESRTTRTLMPVDVHPLEPASGAPDEKFKRRLPPALRLLFKEASAVYV